MLESFGRHGDTQGLMKAFGLGIRYWAGAIASVVAGVGVLAGGLPSRLAVATPALETGRTRLSWSIPGQGWTFRVEEAAGLAGPWTLAPGGEVGTTRTWLDGRLADADGRLFRVVAAPPEVNRGRVISVDKTATYPKAQIGFLLMFAGIPLLPAHDVDVYKVVYETVDPWGLPTVGSMALAIPATAGGSWPLLSYQHGTIVLDQDAPSSGLSQEGLLGVVMATSGYVAVSADYLGLGDSPGRHPYHHAASTATCVVDALRAGKSVCSSRSVALSGKLFLAGYSQGGHATLAALRELEARHAAELPVTACAAMAGAADLSGVTLTDALSDRVPPNAYYFPYLLQMLVDLYGIAPSIGDLLVPPYNATLPPLLDGTSGSGAINAAMPSVPNRVLKPEYLAALRADPDHPVRRALRDNDMTGFVPKAPLRLYHCSGDQDVLRANSVVAWERFRAAGATQVELFDPMAGANHGDCAEPALLAAKAWFDLLR